MFKRSRSGFLAVVLGDLLLIPPGCSPQWGLHCVLIVFKSDQWQPFRWGVCFSSRRWQCWVDGWPLDRLIKGSPSVLVDFWRCYSRSWETDCSDAYSESLIKSLLKSLIVNWEDPLMLLLVPCFLVDPPRLQRGPDSITQGPYTNWCLFMRLELM